MTGNAPITAMFNWIPTSPISPIADTSPIATIRTGRNRWLTNENNIPITMTIRISAAKISTPLVDPIELFICAENAALPVRDIFTPGGGLELSTRL